MLRIKETVRTDWRFARTMVREGGQSLWGAEIEAVIEGDWRLMHNSPFYPWKLFNLANDSSESHDPGNRQGTAGGRLACD